MLKILSFHILLELCLNIIFTGFHVGFSKPITEKKQFLGKLMSSILFNAGRQTGKSTMVYNMLAMQISDEIDKEILKKMKKEVY